MIRRDYILRMIEEFIRALTAIRQSKQMNRLDRAELELDQEFVRLIKTGAVEVAQLSETELLARIIQGEPTLAVREKTLLVTSLLKEAGDIALAQGQDQTAADYYLKGLHLLLETSRGELFEWPEYVPTIESFVTALSCFSLPPVTLARLMQHYESAGDFAKAEDCLHCILETEPSNQNLRQFARDFYRRMKTQSDAALETGNLPRNEVLSALAELEAPPKADTPGIGQNP